MSRNRLKTPPGMARQADRFRRVGDERVPAVAADYPEIKVEHMLVDSCAMKLVTAPATFDVVLTENMFGDIISAETGG